VIIIRLFKGFLQVDPGKITRETILLASIVISG
jgi:hypothetical protein